MKTHTQSESDNSKNIMSVTLELLSSEKFTMELKPSLSLAAKPNMNNLDTISTARGIPNTSKRGI